MIKSKTMSSHIDFFDVFAKDTSLQKKNDRRF